MANCTTMIPLVVALRIATANRINPTYSETIGFTVNFSLWNQKRRKFTSNVAYGNSDKEAGYPADRPVSPEDLAATIYYALGINPELRLPDEQSRPVQILEDGKPLRELFG